MTTTDIINAFQEKIDTSKSYNLAELKQFLTDAYKASKPVKSKIAKDSDESDEEKPKKIGRPANKQKLDKDGNVKEKRAPTAYNKFMSERIKALKQENMETNAKDLMKMASLEWKELSQDEKDEYK